MRTLAETPDHDSETEKPRGPSRSRVSVVHGALLLSSNLEALPMTTVDQCVSLPPLLVARAGCWDVPAPLQSRVRQ